MIWSVRRCREREKEEAAGGREGEEWKGRIYPRHLCLLVYEFVRMNQKPSCLYLYLVLALVLGQLSMPVVYCTYIQYCVGTNQIASLCPTPFYRCNLIHLSSAQLSSAHLITAYHVNPIIPPSRIATGAGILNHIPPTKLVAAMTTNHGSPSRLLPPGNLGFM